MYDDLVTSLHFSSPDDDFVATPPHVGRLMRLGDERFHVGHFVLSLPEDVQWSSEMFDICGLPRQAGMLRLADFVEPFDGTDRLTLADLIRTSLLERQGFQARLRVRRPDDEVRLVEIVGDVVVDGGRLVAIVGLMRDITGQASPPVATSELERMRVLIEAMPVPALLTDPEMRILACSETWAKSHGVIAAQVIGQDVLKAVHKAPVGWSLEHEKVLAGRTVETERTFHNPASGRPSKCACALTPWVVDDGTIRGVITIIGWSDFAYASKEIAAFVKTQRLRA